jgi:hypothetical protein
MYKCNFLGKTAVDLTSVLEESQSYTDENSCTKYNVDCGVPILSSIPLLNKMLPRKCLKVKEAQEILKQLCGDNAELKDGKCVPTSSVCGEDLSFENGKCVPTSSVCGEDLSFENGKCVSTSSNCGDGMTFEDGMCIPMISKITENNEAHSKIANINGKSFCSSSNLNVSNTWGDTYTLNMCKQDC